MPFELINTPTIMQNLINNTLKKYLNRFYIIYLNNILIFSNNKKEYKKYIMTVLKVLEKVGLRIKSKKYAFHINKVEYLKFIITSQRLRMDPVKI